MRPGRKTRETRSQRSIQQSEQVLHQLLGAQPAAAGAVHERRRSADRRRLSVWSVLYGGFRPRRRRLRRLDDGTLSVVDWHETHLFVVSIIILLLSCADAFLTLKLLLAGAHEANPFMAQLIAADVTLFTAVKMTLTGAGVLIMVLLSRYRLFGRLPVVKTLYGVLTGYAVLVVYQLFLLTHIA